MIPVLWISIFIIFYAFLGYGILLFFLIRIRRMINGRRPVPESKPETLPSCTLVVAAYNEEDFIREKISNTLDLTYPEGKLQILFITDGSDDKTPEIIAEYPQIKLMHRPERKGKIAAMQRGVEEIETEIVIFTDANTRLNKDALINIGRHYSDEKVGAVAGKKGVHVDKQSDASAAGEGFYWKYESALKKWDSELYSVVGAAGELFSVRRRLYRKVPDSTILDDFMISMVIARNGYRTVYEPDACATESGSESVSEELKRKIRIAAGGIQSIVWLKDLLNIFKYGVLSFQFISHRVLRWTITPFLIILVFILNIVIVLKGGGLLYILLFRGQVLFYLLAWLGYIMEKRHIRLKILFIPYYFCVMNYAVLAGLIRYVNNSQGAAWERARRKS